MIAINNISQHYGSSQILWELDLQISTGSCTCIMGRNGAGKTTLLKCLMGLLRISSGEILLEGVPLHTKAAEDRAPAGLGYVPQGRRLWRSLTVDEHLKLVAVRGASWTPERIYSTFPRLAERRSNLGSHFRAASSSCSPCAAR